MTWPFPSKTSYFQEMKTAMMLLADPTTSDGLVVIMGALVLLSRALMKATATLLEYPATASHQQLHTLLVRFFTLSDL
jgi:hypothetical protein